jgi:hypothetical protein
MASVSKDRGLYGRRLRPSFETHRGRDAPQDEVQTRYRYDSNFKIAALGDVLFITLGCPWLMFTRS